MKIKINLPAVLFAAVFVIACFAGYLYSAQKAAKSQAVIAFVKGTLKVQPLAKATGL